MLIELLNLQILLQIEKQRLNFWTGPPEHLGSRPQVPVPCLQSCPRAGGMFTAILGPPMPPALATGLARCLYNWKSPRMALGLASIFLICLEDGARMGYPGKKGRFILASAKICMNRHPQGALLAPRTPGRRCCRDPRLLGGHV